MNRFSKLFEPIKFKNGISLKNRIVMSPMTTWASNEDFTISDEEVAYYRARVNGVGMVVTGCTHVTENGIGFTHEFAGYDDRFLPSLKKLADAAKSGGAPVLLQLFHAGNKAIPDLIPDRQVVGASAVSIETAPGSSEFITPKELSEDEILTIVRAFGETTRRAIEAGFDGVEIHGAHGFLIQNFISPFFNKRTDRYGGSLENRLRFGIEVVREVKDVIDKHAQKPFLLGFRISPEEMPQKTYGLKDTYVLIDKLIMEGVDYLHFSLLNAVSQRPLDAEETDIPISAVLNEYVGGRVPVVVAGGIARPEDAVEVLDFGITMAAVARGLVVNPDWVELTQSGQDDKITNVLKLSSVEEKKIPAKLMAIFNDLNGFVPMED
ncbi:NADH:flavin oxidoreductase [Flavobacterium akiainvivens]|uniref:NADH:flavin oxidoreductase n=2 Tax=Flavobacterium akiainvivens TaxID=1202724 RepID=A0A0M9VHN9_9FLAO|nr:NADH:flavin oxidoreductase [Flavobacterium akiainvivens]SFQ77583.1 2,4-dienoyl-CoA reductase [Flavobacterium akiainvivens]